MGLIVPAKGTKLILQQGPIGRCIVVDERRAFNVR